MKSFNISTKSERGAVVKGIVECNDERDHFIVNIPQWDLSVVLDKDESGEYFVHDEDHLTESKLFSDIISQIEMKLYE
ncbi:MAG TPA: hypothetical protein VGE26_11645 [Sphingobacteriaceae bacterium]